MSVNTGKFVADRQFDLEDVGYRVSKENDKIDRMYGFERVKDTKERTGYLINMHSVSYSVISELVSIFLIFLS